jgi:hypothetical protein
MKNKNSLYNILRAMRYSCARVTLLAEWCSIVATERTRRLGIVSRGELWLDA